MNHIDKWAGKVCSLKIGLEYSELPLSLKKLMYTELIEDVLIGFWSTLESEKQTERGNNTHFLLSTERMLPVPSWPISHEM